MYGSGSVYVEMCEVVSAVEMCGGSVSVVIMVVCDSNGDVQW